MQLSHPGLVRLSRCSLRWLIETALVGLGCGLGLVMPNLTVAIQNSVERADMGAATSVSSFIRSLGGALGVAVAGAVVAIRLRQFLPASWTQPTASGGSLLELGVQQIATMPPAQHALLINAYRHAIATTFLTGAAGARSLSPSSFSCPSDPSGLRPGPSRCVRKRLPRRRRFKTAGLRNSRLGACLNQRDSCLATLLPCLYAPSPRTLPNLPNQLTVLRLGMCGLLLISLSFSWPYAATTAFFIFTLASLTDWLDGAIARAYNLVTDLGKLLDPLADKILIIGALVALVERHVAPMWMVVLIIAREFLITGLRIIAAHKQKILAAERIGKHKTISQIVAILVSLAYLSLGEFGLQNTHARLFSSARRSCRSIGSRFSSPSFPERFISGKMPPSSANRWRRDPSPSLNSSPSWRPRMPLPPLT